MARVAKPRPGTVSRVAGSTLAEGGGGETCEASGEADRLFVVGVGSVRARGNIVRRRDWARQTVCPSVDAEEQTRRRHSEQTSTVSLGENPFVR